MRIVGGLLSLLIVSAAPAQAQVVPQTLRELPAATRLRVDLTNRTRIWGTFDTWRADTLSLLGTRRHVVGGATDSQPSARIPFGAIDRLWRYDGRAWGRGAFLGFLFGAAAGMIVVGTVASQGFEGDSQAAALTGLLAGGPLGAMIGFGIGGATLKWKLLVPADAGG